MRKKFFAGAVLLIGSTLAIAGCNATSGTQAKFDQKEYILSIDDSQNFLDKLTLRGKPKSAITFKSSSSEVVEKNGEGVFVAKSSGSAIIEAQVEGRTIASCKVVVKYKMASPKNFKFSDGILSWDRAFVIIDGEEVFADEYQISYKEITSVENVEIKTSSDSQYSFDKEGAFDVTVSAKMTDNNYAKYIDTREASREYRVIYGQCDEVVELRVEQGEDYTKEEATLKWNKVKNGVYDIYLNGICIEENYQSESYLLDYSASSKTSVKEGEEIVVRVVAKDKDKLSNDSSITKIVKRLEKPSLSYVNDDENKSSGRINLEKQNILDECVYVVLDKDGNKIRSSTALSNCLEGYDYGVYKICAYTSGGNNALNSAPTQTISFAKLPAVTFSVDIDKNQANITFERTEYVQRYKIVIDGHETIVTLADSENSYSLDLSQYNLSKGDYIIKVSALPSLEKGNIKPITISAVTTACILNSDATQRTIKVLGEFENMVHRVESGVNQFIFDKIDGATDYAISVNGNAYSDFSVNNTGDRTIISIPNLKNIEPNKSNSYSLEFKAMRKEDGKTTGIESSITKTLQVLGIVSKSTSQNNGSFTFNKVSASDTYYYEIYSVDKDGKLDVGASPVYSRTIYSGNSTIEDLEGGYYKIRIYTKASDPNNYLDSNFYNSNGYFEADFSVEEQIATPTITYNKETNSLNIEKVKFGGGYEIYVDESKNGLLELIDDEDLVYAFSSETFKNAKTYSIKVKAVGGTKYGSEVYRDSSFASLTITKLATPTFEITEEFDEFGIKTGERLDVDNSVANVDKVEYYIGNTKLDEEGYSISFYRPSLGNSFEFKVKYIARDGGLDNYYLDSEENVRTFERIDFPTNLQYKNGDITFTGSSKAVDYYLMIHFVKNDGTELYRKGFELDSKNTSINLQSVLEKQIAIYPNLSSIIENSDKLQVELYGVVNKPRTAPKSYLLYSYNGKTAGGVQTLEIDKLPASTLSFDKTSQILSWTEEKSGSTYDIYANGEVVLSGLTSLSTTLVNKNLVTLNYLNGITLKIKTNNVECLESKFSNEIYIKKLSPAGEISISQSSNVGTIFLSDPTNTSKVLNNGQELNYTLGDVSITKTFAKSETLKIVFVGRDEGNRYYLDSDEAIFNLIEFSKPIIVKEENILSWNDFSNYLNKVSENTIIYTLTIESGSDEYNYTTKNSSIDITNIQTAIGAILQKGEIFVSVKASLGSEYSVQNGGSGCYGENTSEKVTIEKLDILEGESEVGYGSSGNEFNKKINSKIKVTFADKWTKYEDVKIKIKRCTLSLGEYVEASNEDILGVDEKTAYMSLSKVDGQYVLLIDNSYFANAGGYKLKFVVMSNGYIESNVSYIEILRFENISALSVTDSGEVTLSDENNFNGLTAGANGSHLVMLSIGKDSEVREVTKNIPFQISDYSIWENNFGQYTLQAICYDGDGEIIPSDEIFTVSGTKIEGISSFSVNDDGNIVVTLSDSVDIKFKGEINGTIIDDIPFVATEKLNQFTISILDIMELFTLTKEDTYTFNLTVRKDGSVDADWKSVQFLVGTQDYFEVVKDRDNINTYLVIEYNEKTTSFRFDVGERVIILSKDNALITKGYVYYDEDEEGKFSSSKIDDSSLYYAIALDDFLNRELNIEYGDLAFSVSRVSKEGKIIKQHNETFIPLSKLNMIETEELQISDSVLYFAFENKTEANELVGIQYLIDFVADEGGTSFQKIISTTSLDLRNIGLTAGINYTISVRVICSGQGGVSSQKAGNLQTIKYTTPIGVEISNGRLVFNINDFKEGDFAKAIISFAKGEKSEDELLEELNDKIFKSPYYFSTTGENDEIADGKCQLKFVNNGAITGEVAYSSITSMKNLISDFEIEDCALSGVSTFFEVIDYLYRSTTKKPENVSSLFKELVSANRGIGLDKVLFDDIGRKIEKGEYNVQVCQIAGSSGNVDSDYSSIAKGLKVNPAPIIDLVYDNESNQYFADIIPQGGFTNYILQIRNFSEGVYVCPAIYISLNNGKYIARCNNIEVDILREYSKGFSINLSKIKAELEEKSITVLTTETTLTCDIFADDENSLSKSALFDLNYRELDSKNITFRDGYIQINNSSNKSFLIRYKHPQSSTMKEKTFYTNKISLASCNETGKIEYLVLSCPGQISGNSVYIESKRFLIKNAYQLSSLTVKGTENEFNIKLSNNDLEFLNQVYLKISNNKTEKTDSYIVDNLKDCYSTSAGINYRAGKVNGDLNANRFNFDLVGDSLNEFGLVENITSEVADCQLTHDGTLIFSSGRAQAKAEMLPAVKMSLGEGNIKWEKLYNEGDEPQIRTTSADSETTSKYTYADGIVIYEVVIDYFSTSDSDTDTTSKFTQLIYTTSTSLPTDILNDTNGEISYSKYTVTVTALVGEISSEGNIETIEGERYSISKYACYQKENQSIAVLRSAEASKTLSRSEMATDVKVKAGKIEFKTSTTGFTIKATRGEKTIVLKGEESRGNDNKIVFTPNVGEDNYGLEEGYEYTLYIYTYGDESLLSKPVILQAVYKLPEITKERYEINLEFNSVNSKYVTMLDLSKLFEERVAGEKNFKVCISYTTTNSKSQVSEELTSDSCKVAIDGWKTIEMYVTANDENTKNLINSSIIKLNIEKTEIGDLEVEFEDSAKKFKWEWSNGDTQTDKYTYFVELKYVGGTTEKKILDDNVNYYIPAKMEIVSEFYIYARKLDIENYEYTFSDHASLKERFDVKLFNSGEGTESSPYIISSVTEFTNIQFRNEKETYFKLANDLTITQSDLAKNGAFLIDSFNGVLNGNSKTINFTCSTLVATNITLETSNKASVNIAKGCALFKQIAEGAKVLDLNIAMSINSISTTTSEKAIISPIALINAGTVEHVILKSMNTNTNVSLSGNFYIGGIVGINEGEIVYCGVESFDIKANEGSSIYLGGIAVSQTAGSIDLCYNNGNIGTSENITADGILLYQTGGENVANSPSAIMGSVHFDGENLPSDEDYTEEIGSTTNTKFTIEIRYDNTTHECKAKFIKRTGV